MKKPLIIDTNLLVLYVIGMADRRYIASHKRLFPVYREEHYDLLVQLLKTVSTLIITPHTLAETSSLINQFGEPGRKKINAFFQYMLQTTIEHYVRSVDAAQRQEFSFLQLTDSVLLELSKQNMMLLTADHHLHRQAKLCGYDTLNFWHIFDHGLEAYLETASL